MSTLVLSIVGGVVGAAAGPGGAVVGAGIGGAIGSFIDSQIIYPALFPPPNIRNGKVRDIQALTASEGAPIPYLAGKQVRVGGVVIDMSELKEVEKDDEVGGSVLGLGKQKISQYLYFVDLMVAVGEGDTPFDSIERIYANGKVVFDKQADKSITSNQLTVKRIKTHHSTFHSAYGGVPSSETDERMRITSPSGGPDLTIFRGGGHRATISGFSNDENNGVFRLRHRKKFNDGSTRLVVANGGVVTEAAGATVTITQTQFQNDNKFAKEVIFYPGSATQTTDPTFSTLHSGDLPAYRHTGVVVIRDLALATFGNQVPQINFLVNVHAASRPVATEIGKIIERSGLVPADYDASAATGNVRGYVIPGPEAGRDSLDPLMVAFNLIARIGNDGKVYFLDRGDQSVVSTVTGDLGAHDQGAEIAPELDLSDPDEGTLPTEVVTQFIDVNKEYEVGSIGERKIDRFREQFVQLSLPLALDSGEAGEVVGRLLWMPWRQRFSAEVFLPPKYLHLQETDKLLVSAYGETFTIMISEIDIGQNGIIVVRGVVEEAIDYQNPDDDVNKFVQNLSIPASVLVEVMDLPALKDFHAAIPGYYVAVANDDDEIEKWEGASIYIQTGEGSFRRLEAALAREAIMGETVTELAEAAYGGMWDYKNKVRVRIRRGALESVSTEECYAGKNWALVGGEIIAFQNATLVDAVLHEYELSTLLRGLRGSAFAMELHQVDEAAAIGELENFILLNEAVEFIPADLSEFGVQKKIYAGAPGDDVDDLDAEFVTLTGRSMLGMPPWIHVIRYPGETIHLRFGRRSRSLARVFSPNAGQWYHNEEDSWSVASSTWMVRYEWRWYSWSGSAWVLETIITTTELRDKIVDSRVTADTAYQFDNGSQTGFGFSAGQQIRIEMRTKVKYPAGLESVGVAETTVGWSPPAVIETTVTL